METRVRWHLTCPTSCAYSAAVFGTVLCFFNFLCCSNRSLSFSTERVDSLSLSRSCWYVCLCLSSSCLSSAKRTSSRRHSSSLSFSLCWSASACRRCFSRSRSQRACSCRCWLCSRWKLASSSRCFSRLRCFSCSRSTSVPRFRLPGRSRSAVRREVRWSSMWLSCWEMMAWGGRRGKGLNVWIVVKSFLVTKA